MNTTISPIAPSITRQSSDLFLDRLLHPGRFFTDPDAVLRDGTLDIREKRAILSSWASDACAVESMPALRQPPGAPAPVSFDAIMDALRGLDEAGGEAVAGPKPAPDTEASIRLLAWS